MRKKTLLPPSLLLLAAAVLVAWPSLLSAQDIEIGASLSWNFPGFDSTYGHSFIPKFANKPFTGSGGQTIHLQAIAGLGLGGYFNLAMRDHWFLQLSYDPFSSDIQGTSSDYTVALQYTASKPAGTPPQAFSYSYTSLGWQAMGGTIKNSALSLSLIRRIGTLEGLALDLMAGVSYFHFSGSTQAVGFTRFWLDTDGQLHSEDYSLWMDFGPKNAFGGNVGAALNIHFNSNFAVVFAGRYFICPATASSVGFRLIALEGVNETPIDPSKEAIHRNEFKVNGSFLRLSGGFKVVF